jgi:hypothetical protein
VCQRAGGGISCASGGGLEARGFSDPITDRGKSGRNAWVRGFCVFRPSNADPKLRMALCRLFRRLVHVSLVSPHLSGEGMLFSRQS